MLGDITYTEGSPCPTLVLDAGLLPDGGPELLAALAEARRWLAERGGAGILKIALIRPSEHPMFDLDYRFVQALPAGPDRFDMRGTCGHSILGSVLVAGRLGWLPRLAPGTRSRINVLNTHDHVVCELDGNDRRSATFTVHFMPDSKMRLRDMLLVDTPACELSYRRPGGMRRIEVSLVSAGNPYVFVDAARLGVHGQDDLFTAGDGLFDELQAIRRAAADRLGWPPDGVFPKIAALGAFRSGRLAVRAISVPAWHPTLALSGLTCLTAATTIPGTVPHRLARRAGCPSGELTVDTAGGTEAAAAAVAGEPGAERLAWVSVSEKLVRYRGRVFVEPLRHFAVAGEEPCLPLVS